MRVWRDVIWMQWQRTINKMYTVIEIKDVCTLLRCQSFHYDFVCERASHLQIMMHLLIFVCLWMNVAFIVYYIEWLT